MPGRTSKATSEQSGNGWRGFVNVELSEVEWQQVDKEVTDKKVSERVAGHIDYLLELGKLTFNYTNGSVSCSLTILEGVNKGLTVSSFSDNLIEALVANRLKVQNHLGEFEDIFAGKAPKRRRG